MVDRTTIPPPRGLRVFRDITVVPTQGLRHGMGRLPGRLTHGLFRGGPIWPFFALQVHARHCRGPIPFPYDLRPDPEPVVHHRSAGIWCGPASPHFGHMIADFAMRLPEAARADTDWPLVFSVGPPARPEPAPFFWGILAHFGVVPERVVLVGEATHFERLAVPRQAERIGGPSPSRSHLDRMDAVAAAIGPAGSKIPCLFVTRAGLTDGRLAAEPYLADRLEAAGVTVMRPETRPLPEQIDAYRRAERIVFSEGSAVHALQLLGRLPARVAILVRRPGQRLARAALRPRVASLDYWDCTLDQMTGRNRHGRPQWDRALTLFDPQALIARFAAFGLDLSAQWDEYAYRAALRDDIERWTAYNHLLDHHPSGRAAIARDLERVRGHFDSGADVGGQRASPPPCGEEAGEGGGSA